MKHDITVIRSEDYLFYMENLISIVEISIKSKIKFCMTT